METQDSNPVDIPLDSPLRTYPKTGLPAFLSSTYPHGHLSGRPRSRSQQRAFDMKKATCLENMEAARIENAYQETVRKVLDLLERNRKESEETDRMVENLKKMRETELKLICRVMESQGKKMDKQEDEADDKADDVVVKEEGSC